MFIPLALCFLELTTEVIEHQGFEELWEKLPVLGNCFTVLVVARRDQPFYQPKEGTYMKLLVLRGKSGQPHRAHQHFQERCEQVEELSKQT